MKPSFARSRRPEVRVARGPRAFALPRGRVAQLAGGKVRVLGHDLTEQLVVAPGELVTLGTLGDGSLLAVGGRETCVVAPAATAAECHAMLSIGHEPAWAWGDPAAPRRFWLQEVGFVGENELPSQPGAKVQPLGQFKVAEDAVPLLDGRMVELAAGELVIYGARGERRVAMPDDLDLVHLIAVDAGSGWGADGSALVRVDFSGDEVKVVKRVASKGKIISMDAGAHHVAALIAEGNPPRWRIEVRDVHGKELWRAATPFQPPPSQQRRLALALGRFDAIVAVGDEERMALWDLRSRKLIASAPPSK